MASQQAVDIAVEYLEYRRAQRQSLHNIVLDVEHACQRENWLVGWPKEMTADGVAYWLAIIYEAFIMLPDEGGE
jgi:hypothetical protein